MKIGLIIISYHKVVVGCEELIHEKCLEYCLARGEHYGISSYYYHPVFYERKLDLEARQFLRQKKSTDLNV